MSDEGFALLMPFVVVASEGGPYDDESYVAGYEAALVDAWMNTKVLQMVGQFTPPLPFHTANVPQLDLIAMRYGWTMTSEEAVNGWTRCSFTINDEVTG